MVYMFLQKLRLLKNTTYSLRKVGPKFHEKNLGMNFGQSFLMHSSMKN